MRVILFTDSLKLLGVIHSPCNSSVSRQRYVAGRIKRQMDSKPQKDIIFVAIKTDLI